jgi:hypothetical protein
VCCTGRGLLPGALPYLQRALHSPAPTLRRFAVRQAGALAASLAAERGSQQEEQADPGQEEAALQLLVSGLQVRGAWGVHSGCYSWQ